ncbi:hypothetical protein OCK74_16260 [Chitinophagaceae bacterium LB-8]|uniref:Uncharacterized protein n=1 Tax=Paraflavisolibacter caeni TaxID=2982496 RepID=A0A9X3BGC2_9BACT|nr:hypothetical protein [Paraflavisolibacter caeni]MCU7550674.1 hypothetical protein [Paraflavisolibacter caeni]
MIAYNKTWLANLEVHHQLDEAYRYQCISKEELENSKNQYPVGFYIPNFFVRIGLFLLTLVIVLCSFGFFALLFINNSGEKGFGVLLIFSGFAAYTALELLIRKKYHYRSGADDALLWMSGLLMVAGLNLLLDIPALGNAVIIFLLSFYLMLRFVDALMSAIAVLSMAGILFYTYIELGSFAKVTMPFLLMAFFAFVYVFTKRKTSLYYANCLLSSRIVALVCFYLSGNYFIVRETGNELLGLGLAPGASLPLGWLFWLLTISTPLVYIFMGIQKKDSVLLRVGLLLVAATVVTICYYYQVLSLEAIMCMSGMMLIAIAYAFIRYLRLPRNGYTCQELNEPSLMDKLQVESIIVTQTFGQPAQETSHTKFGGGTGGGGGASGDF